MPAMVKLVRPHHFLFFAGTFLVTLGTAGAMGLLSSISGASVFNPPYWIKWVHLMFGIIVLGIAKPIVLRASMPPSPGVGVRRSYLVVSRRFPSM